MMESKLNAESHGWNASVMAFGLCRLCINGINDFLHACDIGVQWG